MGYRGDEVQIQGGLPNKGAHDVGMSPEKVSSIAIKI